MTNHYTVLGVGPGASQSDIKAAFRATAKASHPDHHPNDSEAEARFKAANAAYAVLSDPVQRAAHDAELAKATTTRTHVAPAREAPARPPVSTPKRRKRRATPPPKRHQPPPPHSPAVVQPNVVRASPPAAAPAPRSGSGWDLLVALGVAALGVAAATSNGWDDNAKRYRSRSSGQFRSARWGK